MVAGFAFSRSPRIVFGPGTLAELGAMAAGYGRHALLLTGRRSLEACGRRDKLLADMKNRGLKVTAATVDSEPTVELVDALVASALSAGADLVVAVGGGSVLDAGKAAAAMLPLGESVADYLEAAGAKVHPGCKRPMIAVPTTAGTGTEATQNASLRRPGPQGFKRSLRHQALVPEVALIDPELALTCPPAVTAACGLDALAQLLESFVSPRASRLSDALAAEGLRHAGRCLVSAYEAGQDLEARAGMAYAALLSGITLANAGLGIVHSLASALGGLFEIPHGVICGTLLAPGMAANIAKLRAMNDHAGLAKHAAAWQALSGQAHETLTEDCEALANLLAAWAQELAMPRLSAYGVQASDLDRVVELAGLRNNPAPLTRPEIRALLSAGL